MLLLHMQIRCYFNKICDNNTLISFHCVEDIIVYIWRESRLTPYGVTKLITCMLKPRLNGH
jgi:hypothetical protein